MSDQHVTTAAVSSWQYGTKPTVSDSKVLLLTNGGVAVFGQWRDNAGFIAWAPLPKRNKQLEKELGLC